MTLTLQAEDTPPITNLVFEGSGIRGIAYAGTLQALEEAELLPQIERVAGTSGGAITALAITLGYDSNEMESLVGDTDFGKFNDSKGWLVGGLVRLQKKFGFYEGDRFSLWLAEAIAAKTGNPDITFAELSAQGYPDLYVTGTCLNRQELLVFSCQTYPDMRIRDAVRISMAVPFYFEPLWIDSEGKVYDDPNEETRRHLDIVVDGGMIGNFPIAVFDTHDADGNRLPNWQTLGFRLDSKEQIEKDQDCACGLAHHDIGDFRDYVSAFYILAIEHLNRETLIPEDWDRTVSISTVDIGPKVRKLSAEEKERLVTSGYEHTKTYFEQETDF